MKLQTKYDRAIITPTIVLLVASIVYYFFIRSALISHVDKSLGVEEVERYHYIKLHNDISAALKDRLSNLEEMIHSHESTANADLKEPAVSMHPMLADILINNMFVNAIRHGNSKGVINISTKQGSMQISHSGEGAELDRNTIYNRFEKSNASEGTGLGLAIVKQICDSYQFRIEYAFQKGLHDFTIIYN